MNIKTLPLLFPLSQGSSFLCYPYRKEKKYLKHPCYWKKKKQKKISFSHLSLSHLWAHSHCLTKRSTNTQNGICPAGLLSRVSSVKPGTGFLQLVTSLTLEAQLIFDKVPRCWMWYQSQPTWATPALESLEQQHTLWRICLKMLTQRNFVNFIIYFPNYH